MKTIKRMWAWMTPGEANENEISFFDVKVLYDAAYEEKDRARASLKRSKDLLAQAEAMEAIYRAQLKAPRHQPAYSKAAA